MIKKSTGFICLILTSFIGNAQMPEILSMKDRSEVIDQWMEERFKTVLPALMEREKINMWIIIAREYNEDPVIKTMLPSTWLAARRRTILIIYNPGNNKALETLAVARYDVGNIFKKSWDKAEEPDQWKRLMEIIEEKNPLKIGLNKSEFFALADGLSNSEYEAFMKYLPEKYHHRVVSAVRLAIGWLETRTPSEMTMYRQICKIAHVIIAEAFSEKVIKPEVTSTEDVVWWLRERIRELKLTTWFHPSVAVQRADPESFDHLRTFSKRPEKNIILPGDLLHVDFGITYLRLNTDTQQHAYVLKPGETEAPEYLKKALAEGNRLLTQFIIKLSLLLA